ncbi:hypothetical protein [Viridibacillus sp. FSL R5-0888]|uniref:hypothetical protein n=1 Tax=Viridibacillus sp. FSL R5-0888 TaxID=2921663 RepID=UPI0030F78324
MNYLKNNETRKSTCKRNICTFLAAVFVAVFIINPLTGADRLVAKFLTMIFG